MRQTRQLFFRGFGCSHGISAGLQKDSERNRGFSVKDVDHLVAAVSELDGGNITQADNAVFRIHAQNHRAEFLGR